VKRVAPKSSSLRSRPSERRGARERRAGIRSNVSGLISLRPNDIGKQVPPCRIELFDKYYFPIPPPALHGTLALCCNGSVAVCLEIDEAVDPVFACESFDHAFAMLPCASGQITGHANVENAARFAGRDINPVAFWLLQHVYILDVIPGLRNGATLRYSPGNANCWVFAQLAPLAFPEAALSGSETLRLSGITSNPLGLLEVERGHSTTPATIWSLILFSDFGLVGVSGR
jgi:hypothetical protein